MDESDTHSFVIKIWKDEESEPGKKAQWYGHITHAFSREKAPIKNLTDILIFMKPYLKKMNVKLQRQSRLVLWLSKIWRREHH